MRLLLLIIGISLFGLDGICQTPDFKFFQTSERKNGKQFAKALIPAVIDSVAFYERYEYSIYEPQEVKTIDTVFFFGFMVLKNPENFKHIAHLADTTQELFQLAKPTTFFHFEDCNHNREWITQQFEKVKGYESWALVANEQQLSPGDWTIRPIQNYGTHERLIVRNPCNTRESTYPIPFTNLIRIIPKRTLTPEEQALINQYTKDYETYQKTHHFHVDRLSKTIVKEAFKYSLTRAAGIDLVEVYSNKETKKLMPKIISKLVALNFLQESETGNSKAVQKALLRYQYTHSLPIGQYGKESIDWLIGL